MLFLRGWGGLAVTRAEEPGLVSSSPNARNYMSGKREEREMEERDGHERYRWKTGAATANASSDSDLY